MTPKQFAKWLNDTQVPQNLQLTCGDYNEVHAEHATSHPKYLDLALEVSIEDAQYNVEDDYDIDDIDYIFRNLEDEIPEYFEEYGIYFQDMLYPTTNKGRGGVKLKKHIKFTQHISKWVNIKINSILDIRGRKALIDNCISQLGDIYARNRSTQGKVIATITNDIRAFISLGQMNIDNESCFRHSSNENWLNKFNLAMSANSVVVLFSTKVIESYDDLHENNDITGRMWGFIEDDKALHLNNLYSNKKKLCEKNALLSAFELGRVIVNKNCKLKHNILNCDYDYIYMNDHPRWSFVNPSYKKSNFCPLLTIL